MTMSVAPVNASTKSTFVHVRPASVVLNTPRSWLAAHRVPAAATYATFGSVGCSAMRPIARVTCRPRYPHVSPPSVDRYTPPPHEELCRLFCSPDPAQTMFVSPSKIASAPKALSGCRPNTSFHVTPLLVDFQMPPVAAAT